MRAGIRMFAPFSTAHTQTHSVFKWKIQENGSRCNLLVICTVASRLLLLLLAFDGDGDVGWVVMVLSVPYNV